MSVAVAVGRLRLAFTLQRATRVEPLRQVTRVRRQRGSRLRMIRRSAPRPLAAVRLTDGVTVGVMDGGGFGGGTTIGGPIGVSGGVVPGVVTVTVRVTAPLPPRLEAVRRTV